MKWLLLLLVSFGSWAHQPSNKINKLALCTQSADVLNHHSYWDYRNQTKEAIRHKYFFNTRQILWKELDEAERKIERKARKRHTSRREVARDILYSPRCEQDYRFEVRGSLDVGGVNIQQNIVEPKEK